MRFRCFKCDNKIQIPMQPKSQIVECENCNSKYKVKHYKSGTRVDLMSEKKGE